MWQLKMTKRNKRCPIKSVIIIVQLCGDVPRIELFARQEVEGWDCWGNEVNLMENENAV